jgi:hypothetical protein
MQNSLVLYVAGDKPNSYSKRLGGFTQSLHRILLLSSTNHFTIHIKHPRATDPLELAAKAD